MQPKKRFSVIFCTYNREKYILNALESIARQDFPKENYEVVLVNNNSTDRTEELCLSFQKEYPTIAFHYVVETQQGLSYARNRGIKESTGELLVYVDDDATVFPGYLKALDDFFRSRTDAIAAGGPIIPSYETDPPAWLSHYTKALLTGYLYLGDKIKPFRQGKYPGGGNACYRAGIFEQVGLFNPELGRKGNNLIGAEEKDLFSRITALGHRPWYIPDAGIYHHIPPEKLTKGHLIRLANAIGKSERIRTLSVSRLSFAKRIVSEGIKWLASLVLYFVFAVRLQTEKGNMLLLFRMNVTGGLLGKDEIS